jgi:cytidylate kinase
MKSSRGSSGKVVICVCGLTGCGKSSVARRLAERYGLRHFSGGDALKALAVEAGYKPFGRGWWESKEGLRFLKLRTEDSDFDRRVDEKLLEVAKSGNVVLDSWTMPWLFDGGFKVWFEASSMARAKRVAKRDRVSVGAALRVLRAKDALTRRIFKGLYGFVLGEDFGSFDLVLDTDLLGVREVFGVVCLVLDRLVFGGREGNE